MRAQIEELGKLSDPEITALPFRDRKKTTGIEEVYRDNVPGVKRLDGRGKAADRGCERNRARCRKQHGRCY